MPAGWTINPLMFLELFFVLAFAAGWWILERVAVRADRRSKEEQAAERRRAAADRDGDDRPTA